MGLAVCVGYLADLLTNDPEGAEWAQEYFETINHALAENDLPMHEEPSVLTPFTNRCETGGYPYSYLHYLRRFYARTKSDQNWQPVAVAEGEDPSADPAIDEESAMLDSHLLCHSDAEGCYVPIDFPEPIISDEVEVPGGLIGSSQKLLEELLFVAPKLQIQLVEGELSDAEAARLNQICGQDTDPFCIEKLVWFSLYEAAQVSIKTGAAIVFT